MSAEFDRHTPSYVASVDRAVAFSGRSLDFFTRAKGELLLDRAARAFDCLETLDVLDVGCGIGLLDSLLASEVRSVTGVDVSRASIDEARHRNPGSTYVCYDGERLPFQDGSFHVSFAICVLHHVVGEARTALVREMRRVTVPGGIVFIVEHNPLNPLTRLAVARCDFDEDVELLRARETRYLLERTGLLDVRVSHFLLLPWRGALATRIEQGVARLPLGAQYAAMATAPGP